MAHENHLEITQLQSWNDLLSLIFQTDTLDQSKGAKKIKQVNIKEQILSNYYSGDFIKKISQEYDGILTFSMTLLTMISSTNFAEKYTPGLNEILESLGGSTQITLLQNRLLTVSNRQKIVETEFN